MDKPSKCYANVCLRISINEPITNKEKEELLFSIRDRVKSVMTNHHIEQFNVLFSVDIPNNQE